MEQDAGGDTVLLDLSPLRLRDASGVEAAARRLAVELGVEALPSGAHPSPFTVIVPNAVLDLHAELAAEAGGGAVAGPCTDARCGDALEATPSPDAAAAADERASGALEHLLSAPIWQQPPRMVCFRCARPEAKALAKLLAGRLAEESQELQGASRVAGQCGGARGGEKAGELAMAP